MLILIRCLKPMNPLFQPDNSWLRCVWGEGKHNVAILNKTIIILIIVQIINHRDNQSQDLHQITSEGIVWSQNFLAVMRWPDWGIRRRNIFDAANNDDQCGNQYDHIEDDDSQSPLKERLGKLFLMIILWPVIILVKMMMRTLIIKDKCSYLQYMRVHGKHLCHV